MTHTETIKDSRGKLEISVTLWINDSQYAKDIRELPPFRYDIYVWHTQPNKRKAEKNNAILLCTEAELMCAKLALWNKLQPKQ